MGAKWTDEDIVGILALQDALEAPEFVAATWPDRGHIEGVARMPYPDYHPILLDLIERGKRAYAGQDPNKRLPEDPADTKPIEVLTTPADFETATIAQILRYFFLCARAERVGDGHIDAEFGRGNVVAALHRLRILRDQG